MTCQTCSQTPPNYQLITIPDGAAGTREVLKRMRDAVRTALQNPDWRELAAAIVWAAGVWEKNFSGEVVALFDFVRARIRYTLDTHNVEVVQTPDVTLGLGFGDCDDSATLLATLCEAIGHPCEFWALGFDQPGEYSHVIVMAYPGDGEAGLSLDVTEPHSAGWFPPNPSCVLLAPI